MTLQRYVADELTHLTGRDKEPEDAYAALVSILTSGILRHSGEAIPHGTIPDNPLGGGFRWDPAADLIGHEMFMADMVCFCDIPIADMALHAGKYSPFGLAFPRRFLVEKGATPVFYVASNARAVGSMGSVGSLADVSPTRCGASTISSKRCGTSMHRHPGRARNSRRRRRTATSSCGPCACSASWRRACSAT